LESHWHLQPAAAAAPATPDIAARPSADAPPVLVRWRAKVLTQAAIRRVQDNAAEWGYPLEEFPILEELQDMQLRLRMEAHAVLRKAKEYLFMAELSSDSD
jgi:hypothetical protein